MKLDMQVGLGPGHIVLDEDSGPPPPRAQPPFPQFLAHICCGEMALWIKMPRGMEVGLDPSDIVLDGDPPPLPKKVQSPPPIFCPCLLWPHSYMDQAATWLVACCSDYRRSSHEQPCLGPS